MRAFAAIWYVVNQKQGVSALGRQRVLGFGSYQTAWSWLHKLRRTMVLPGRELLAGAVEIDESYIGGSRPGKRGRGAAGKAIVVIAVEDHDSAPGPAGCSCPPSKGRVVDFEEKVEREDSRFCKSGAPCALSSAFARSRRFGGVRRSRSNARSRNSPAS